VTVRVQRRWPTFLAWSAVAIGALAVGMRWAPIDSHPILIVAALSPYLAAGCAFAAVCLLAGRRWWAALAVSVPVIAMAVVQAPMFAGPRAAPAASVPVRVMTANIMLGAADAIALARLAAARADIVVIQELTAPAARRLEAAGIGNDFPHQSLDAQPGAVGTGVWSRYPISGTAAIDGFSLRNLAMRIAVPGTAADTVVLAVHVVGPWPQPIDGWRREITALGEILPQLAASAGRGAVVAAGDFNATYDMRPFRNLLGSGFLDAVEQTGRGPALTFPADSPIPPLIGIDHILTYQSTAADAEAVRVAGSDHLGLIATVHLPAR
jgi:endonuclease/exonuclease/phosphatase (EEP) superfamily protein YafD